MCPKWMARNAPHCEPPQGIFKDIATETKPTIKNPNIDNLLLKSPEVSEIYIYIKTTT
jgi:hypothetical protein